MLNHSVSRLLLAIAVCAAVISAAPVFAQDDGGTSKYRATVSFNPLLLLDPIFEVTAEFRVLPMIGVAAIGGGGARTRTVNSGFGDATAKDNLFVAGVQASYYLSGNFDEGIHAGFEVMYARSQLVDSAGTPTASAPSTSTTVGAIGGYKLNWPISRQIGLTGLLQAGYGWVVASSKGTSSDSKAEPLLNVQFGASF
ncbi:MAG: hypothetical protein EXR77_03870 [Myxococcales bacterium]|nr:hypothetical protein [Myxococcales bacterium]